jgi:hypothetical protein
MKRIVQDRLDRSSSMAFRARLPTRAPGKKDAHSRSGRVEGRGSGTHVSENGQSRLPCAAGKDEAAHPRVQKVASSLPPHLKAKLASLRERQDKSFVRWDRLDTAIRSRGGLAEVDAKQCWGEVMAQLRVDPSKIEPDSSSILRTWYKEKKRAREMKEARWRTNSKRRRNESDDSWEPEKASRGGSLPSSQPCDRAGAESGSDQEEEEVPLRPRKLTERLYQQHNRHLKELFALSLLGSTPSEPRWRACTVLGNPCVDTCNCQWTSFATGVGALQPEPKAAAAAAAVNVVGTDEPSPQADALAAASGASARDVEADALPGLAATRPTLAPSAGRSPAADSQGRAAVEARAQRDEPHLHQGAAAGSGRGQSTAPNGSAAAVAASRPQMQVGFVCLSSVAGKSTKSPCQQTTVEERRMSGPHVPDQDHGLASGQTCAFCHKPSVPLNADKRCAPCKEAERERGRSASVLSRWWRQVRVNLIAASEPGSAAGAGAGAGDAAEGVAAVPDAPKVPQLELKMLDSCPHCAKIFTNWIYQQRAALAKKHMIKCCPHLLPALAAARPCSINGKQAVQRVRLPLDTERKSGPEAVGESDEPDRRFTDPFSAYRCCGRTFLRTHDLERHWARTHTHGVVACARGYADPCNLRRKTNNQLGLGVCLCCLQP